MRKQLNHDFSDSRRKSQLSQGDDDEVLINTANVRNSIYKQMVYGETELPVVSSSKEKKVKLATDTQNAGVGQFITREGSNNSIISEEDPAFLESPGRTK